MTPISTRTRKLSLGQTVLILTAVFILYRVFKSPELDQKIEKFAGDYSDPLLAKIS